MAPKGIISVNSVTFGFVRRRYGKRTFTWLWYICRDGVWREYKGDPWPSVIVPRKDLEEISREILANEKV